jgi:hypothetical protein
MDKEDGRKGGKQARASVVRPFIPPFLPFSLFIRPPRPPKDDGGGGELGREEARWQAHSWPLF